MPSPPLRNGDGLSTELPRVKLPDYTIREIIGLSEKGRAWRIRTDSLRVLKRGLGRSNGEH